MGCNDREFGMDGNSKSQVFSLRAALLFISLDNWLIVAFCIIQSRVNWNQSVWKSNKKMFDRTGKKVKKIMHYNWVSKSRLNVHFFCSLSVSFFCLLFDLKRLSINLLIARRNVESDSISSSFLFSTFSYLRPFKCFMSWTFYFLVFSAYSNILLTMLHG